MISYLVIGICVSINRSYIFCQANKYGNRNRRNINEKNNSDKLENEDEDIDETISIFQAK